MHLYTQNAKTTHSAVAEMGGFVLVEAARPKPRADKVSWVTHPFGMRRHDFFKIPNEDFSLHE